jgi:hypothetical protein
VTTPPANELEAVFGGAGHVLIESAEEGDPTATAGIWRVRQGSQTAVLKLIRHKPDGNPRWPSAEDPAHPYYWRREALAYTSGLLARFGPGLRAPALLGCFERPDGSLALWLEDLPEPEGAWTAEHLASVAHRLGVAHAALVQDLPDEPWLARDWLREYLRLHDVLDPEAERVLARLDALPQTLCHNDLHPANVMAPERDVIIDWAYVGIGALGLDAGVLVADGVADDVIAAELADTAGDEVWRRYVAGLRDGGWGGAEDDVRYAFLRGTSLRLSWLPRGVRPAWDGTVALLDGWRERAGELA